MMVRKDAVIGKIDGFFEVKKNTNFEKARFKCRNQLFVKKCGICIYIYIYIYSKESQANLKPMITIQLPDYPWQRVGTYLFQLKRFTLLL